MEMTNEYPNFATFKSECMYVHKKVGGKKKKCPKGNSLLLPSNDDGQPVANLFAVDYDKEALRGGVVLLKKPHRRGDMTGRACKRVFLM